MRSQEKYFLLFALLFSALWMAAAVQLAQPPVGEGTYSVSTERRAEAPTAPARPLVDVNTATAEELETLDGIGAVLAQRIVDYREAHGDFSSAEDLLQVSGIGEKTLAGFRHRISLGGDE